MSMLKGLRNVGKYAYSSAFVFELKPGHFVLLPEKEVARVLRDFPNDFEIVPQETVDLALKSGFVSRAGSISDWPNHVKAVDRVFPEEQELEVPKTTTTRKTRGPTKK